MSNPVSPIKRGKLLVVGIVAVLAVGLFAVKVLVESKIEARIMEDLRLYEPYLHLESAKVEASYFSASVTLKNVVYTIPDLPGLRVSIEKATQEGIDRDTLMGKPGVTSSVKKATASNMRVFVQEFEQPIMEIGSYEVADIVYPYRAMRAAMREAKESQDIMAMLKILAPVLQEVDMQSGPGLVRDLKMNLGQADLFDMHLREVTASGFKSLDKESTGYDALLENAQYKDMKITGQMYDGSEIVGTLDLLEIKNLRYSYKELFAALAEFDPESDPVGFLSATLPALYNYSFDALNMHGFSVSAADGLFTLESVQLGPRTLKEQGPNLASNMKLHMNEAEVFSLEAIGLDKVVLSDLMVQFISAPNSIIENPEMAERIEDNPFMILDGFRLENLYIKNLSAPGLVSLEAWSSSGLFGQGKASLTSRLDKLHISQQGAQQLGMLSMFFGSTLSDICRFMAMNPEGVKLDGAFELLMDAEPDKIGYKLTLDVAESTAALFFAASGETAPPSPYEAYGPPMFSLIQLRLADNGLLDNACNYIVQQGGATSAAEARNLLVQELDEGIAQAKPGEANLLRGLRNFLSQGGSIRLDIRPKRPMLLEDADIFDGADELNILVEHVK